MLSKKTKRLAIYACVASVAVTGCAQLGTLRDRIPAISGGESTADRASRLTAGRANQVLKEVCFPQIFESVPLEIAAESIRSISVASPGVRPGPLPEIVWSFRDTPFLAFWGFREGAGCSIAVFDGELDAALSMMTETMREKFGRKGSVLPNPFARLPIRTHAQVKGKEIGPLTVKYEKRTFSLRITAQNLKDPVSDTLPGYVFSLKVLP